jgi:hypothetical protein
MQAASFGGCNSVVKPAWQDRMMRQGHTVTPDQTHALRQLPAMPICAAMALRHQNLCSAGLNFAVGGSQRGN